MTIRAGREVGVMDSIVNQEIEARKEGELVKVGGLVQDSRLVQVVPAQLRNLSRSGESLNSKDS